MCIQQGLKFKPGQNKAGRSGQAYTLSPCWTHRKEAIQIVKATYRQLGKVQINYCRRKLKCFRHKLRELHEKLKQLVPTDLLDAVMIIADKPANKTSEHAHHTGPQQKLTWLLHDKEQKWSKPEDNWVSNISSRPLYKTETRVLSYRLKHSVTPKMCTYRGYCI